MACLLCCAGAARAEEPSVADLEKRLAAQQAKIDEQERRLQDQDRRLLKQESRSYERDQELRQRILGLGPNGFALGSRDSGFQLRLRGVVQADGRAFFGTAVNQPLPDQFLIRRARPILEGTIGDFVDFR
ncbi:MAG TPA: hypothetical protein VF334_05030, partial [Polyangia bacterium]